MTEVLPTATQQRTASWYNPRLTWKKTIAAIAAVWLLIVGVAELTGAGNHDELLNDLCETNYMVQQGEAYCDGKGEMIPY